MPLPLPYQLLHITIDRRAEDVYRFVSNPANLPAWASGLANGIEQVGARFFAESPQGRLEVRFAPDNRFGILDHEVLLPEGGIVVIPMRVIANGDGSLLTFTLFRQPGMSEQKFSEDQAWVTRDLEALKALLEA